MARRRARSADAPVIANDPLSSLLQASPVRPMEVIEDVFTEPSIPHDRRLFQFHEPEVFKMEVSDGISYGVSSVAPPSGVRVATPSRVAVCVRREQRREVLHALRRTGGGGRKRRRYNEWSNISCK